MGYIHDCLKNLAALNYDPLELEKRFKAGELDSVFGSVTRVEAEIKTWGKLFWPDRSAQAVSYQRALENLGAVKDAIESFYTKKFTRHDIVGSEAAYRTPDAIVILGCREPLLKVRLDRAVDLLDTHPDTLVILTGGGAASHISEARQMEGTLRERGIKNPVCLEEDSMDTIGNALFTKLILKKNRRLAEIKRLLVLTSDFHALRSYFYFQKVWMKIADQAEDLELGVAGIPSLEAGDRNIYSSHELLSENAAEQGVFQVDELMRPEGVMTDSALLILMVLKHPLYANRSDLIRKYIPAEEI